MPSDVPVQSKKLRTSESFDWESCCLFCTGKRDLKHDDMKKWRSAMTLELKESILKSDEWGVVVSCRLESCADLVAEETIYHMACYLNFVSQNARHEQIGRPIDEGKMDAFNKVCDWLERDGDCELHTVKLMEKMKEFSANEDNTYTEKSLRKKLKEKYKEHIHFTDIPGRQSVVCFKDMVSHVLYEKKKKKEETK